MLDFGLAKRTDRDSQDETQAYVVPGSPKYMAPEAIHQRPIDGRVDMYALGVMLYYMLAGAVPFDRENPMDILRAHLHEQPRPLRVMNPNVQVPEALEMIVMRCLAKTPEERFTDMQQLLDTLRAFSRSLQRPSAPRLAPVFLRIRRQAPAPRRRRVSRRRRYGSASIRTTCARRRERPSRPKRGARDRSGSRRRWLQSRSWDSPCGTRPAATRRLTRCRWPCNRRNPQLRLRSFPRPRRW